MSICKYCGQKVGLFSDCHKECEAKHAQGLVRLRTLMDDYFRNPNGVTTILQEYQQLVKEHYQNREDIANIAGAAIDRYADSLHRPFSASILQIVSQFLIQFKVSYSDTNQLGAITRLSQKIIKGHIADYFTGAIDIAQMQGRIHKVISSFPILPDDINDTYQYMLNKAADNFLKDGQLTGQEEHLLNQYMAALNIQVQNLPVKYQSGSITKIAQTSILNNIQAGNLPNQPSMLPIVLGKGESLLWTYNNVTLYQEKIEKEYVGRHNGVSVRVIKGVTLRTGKMKGKPVEHSYMNNMGTGELYVTNKHLIFQSPTKAVKVPFAKLIGITPYTDGIEVHKEGDTKRLVLQGFDSWFVMCLLQIVNQ